MTTPRLLSSRYELGNTLGYGGMSEVHKGRDIRLGREVAVKVLRADLARDPQFQERFRREAQNAAALNHPAIVAVYDTGETRTENGPLPYIVMEYVAGRTLRDIVKTEGPLPGQRAMEIMADVCAALDFSHRHGIIHRDVKPANVMITRTGAVKVMDFGIARAVHDGQAAVTQTAAVIGTAQYLSPEQARGEAVDARSDVYATGCVLFELLTGEPPFTGDSPVAVAYQHVREEPRPPSALNPRVSPALDAIVLKAMSKAAANRYQSAAEMRMDLVRVLSGQRPIAPAARTAMIGSESRTQVVNSGAPRTATGRHRPDVPVDDYDDDPHGDAEEDAQRRKRRRAWLIGLAVLLVVALVGLIFWSLGTGNQQQAATTAEVPNLIGQQQSAARLALQKAGFTAPASVELVACQAGTDGSRAPCTASDIDKVFDTDPPAGSSASVTQVIKLKIGKSPDSVSVPDVKGLSVPDATAQIEAAGLTVAQGDPQEEETTDPNLVGKVSKTTPTAGTSVEKGSPITLIVGKAQADVPVPDVRGDTYDDAKSTLEGQGFNVQRQDVDSNEDKGTVISQSATKAKPGATITLKVSKGPTTTTPSAISLPNLSGMTPDDAASYLRESGWNGSINVVDEVPTADRNLDGTIARQSPSPNSQISPNQTINVWVYKRAGLLNPPTH